MDVPHFKHPELFEWLLADEVLDFVEAFIGPDIALWSSHFISKPPGDGKRVPWHEDSALLGAQAQRPTPAMHRWRSAQVLLKLRCRQHGDAGFGTEVTQTSVYFTPHPERSSLARRR